MKKRKQTNATNSSKTQSAPRSSAVAGVETRDPEVTTRDPQPAPRKPRRYIPASMPTVCPACGHSTRMADGRHVDPVRHTVLEYRTCNRCGELLAAGRPMTPVESETLCTRADAVAEYEATITAR